MHEYFLDIPVENSQDEAAPLCVLPLPYERTTSYGKGTAGGPAAILDASYQIEDYDTELAVPIPDTVHTLPAPDFTGLSDVQALDRIESTAHGLLSKGQFLLALGGEHTVSLPLVRAAQACHQDLCILHLDAHLDLRDSYQGTGLSHACVMRRIHELGLATAHAGIRSFSRAESEFVERAGIPLFMASRAEGPDNTWIGDLLARLGKRVYLSIDIDVFDPSLVPGTGTPEPGGLYWPTVAHLLKRLFGAREVVAADIVETAPIKGTHVSEFTAARLGARILTLASLHNANSPEYVTS